MGLTIKVPDLGLEFRCEFAQVFVRDAVRELSRQPVAFGDFILKFLPFMISVHLHEIKLSAKSSNFSSSRK